jgi:hypothetical protein
VKRCPACGDVKESEAFGRNRALPDGLSFYCLLCNRKRNSAWYRQSPAAKGQDVRDHSWVPAGFRWCPACQRAVAHEVFSRNSRQASDFGSTWRACKRRSSNSAYWVRRYGLTKPEVDRIRHSQGYRCAICADPGLEHLDHDHDTGGVRSPLCQWCNFALGLYRDDPALLRVAARYIEAHLAGQAAGPLPGQQR